MTPHRALDTAELLTSRQNARLKELRDRLGHPSREADGWIAIEGIHLVEEAARSGLTIETLFFREDWRNPDADLTSRAARVFRVAADAFDHACATRTPQGVAAIVRAPGWALEELLDAPKPRIVVLAGLQDPGNVGTILRTAEAFDATGVLLVPPAVSPWNQKVLRAAAGSSFRLPVVSLENAGALERLQDRGIVLHACLAGDGNSAPETNLRRSWGLVIGSEGSGIPADVLQFCSASIHIPCPGPVESLNAAVAASILLYEAFRQRDLSR